MVTEFIASDLAFGNALLERAFTKSMCSRERLGLDRTWALVQTVALPLFLIKVWPLASGTSVAQLAGCALLFAVRFLVGSRTLWYQQLPWLRPLLLLATDTLHLAVSESVYHLYVPPQPELHSVRLLVQLTAGNPGFFLALLTMAAGLPFRHHMLLHTGNTFIVLAAVHKHCQAGGGFEAGYRRLLWLTPLADPQAAAARCTTVQVVCVLVVGYVLPSVWLYLREWRSRRRFLQQAGASSLAEGDTLIWRVCDALLLLVPLAAMMASLVLTAMPSYGPGVCTAVQPSAGGAGYA